MLQRPTNKRLQKRLASEERIRQREHIALKKNQELVETAREMYVNGHTRAQIAKLLRKSESWASDAVRGINLQESFKLARHRIRLARGEPLKNPWLDPFDEANIEGYSVPTPLEIKERAAQIRRAQETGDYSELEQQNFCFRCPDCRRQLKSFSKGVCTSCWRKRNGGRSKQVTRNDAGEVG